MRTVLRTSEGTCLCSGPCIAFASPGRSSEHSACEPRQHSGRRHGSVQGAIVLHCLQAGGCCRLCGCSDLLFVTMLEQALSGKLIPVLVLVPSPATPSSGCQHTFLPWMTSRPLRRFSSYSDRFMTPYRHPTASSSPQYMRVVEETPERPGFLRCSRRRSAVGNRSTSPLPARPAASACRKTCAHRKKGRPFRAGILGSDRAIAGAPADMAGAPFWLSPRASAYACRPASSRRVRTSFVSSGMLSDGAMLAIGLRPRS